MKLVTILCIFLTLSQFVSTEKFLFREALVTFREIDGYKAKNRTVFTLTAIDNHHYYNVTNLYLIPIKTKVSLHEGAVRNLPHLRVLRLKQCGIEALPPRTFLNLPVIEKLHLQENSIRSIAAGVFNGMQIQELWLHKNSIASIESSAFDDMPRLNSIKLNNNKLEIWDSNWFVNTPQLTYIYFRRNSIRVLPERAFANIKASHKDDKGHELVDTQIYLSSNKISYIDPKVFEGIDALDALCLRKNNLEDIDWTMFSHVSELHNLTLKQNRLDRIDIKAFENMSEMLELDLSGNLLECIPSEILEKVKLTINLKGNERFRCHCLDNLWDKIKSENLPVVLDDENLNCVYYDE